MFYLVKVKFEEGETPLPDYGPYETGPEAAKVAKQLEAQLGVKVQPRRIAQAPDWRGRAQARFDSGEWEKLPKKWDLPPVKDHYAHLVTIGGVRCIAFYEDETKAVIDRCTSLTAGRYIARYHAKEVESDERQRALIAAIDPSGQLLFARTQDEIEYVYVHGPQSCMSGERDESYGVHPVRFYGAGDLAVAHLKQGLRITARAVCWPERKLYGRMYGDEARLKAVLESEGFRSLDRIAGERFIGARCAKVTTKRNSDWFVVPYLDDFNGFIEDGDYFVSVDQQRIENAKPGDRFIWDTGPLRRYCPQLKRLEPANGFRRVEGVGEEWSANAIARYCFICDMTKKVWPASESVCLDSGHLWSKEAFAEHGYTDAKGRRLPLLYLEENGGGWRRDGTCVEKPKAA